MTIKTKNKEEEFGQGFYAISLIIVFTGYFFGGIFGNILFIIGLLPPSFKIFEYIWKNILK